MPVAARSLNWPTRKRPTTIPATSSSVPKATLFISTGDSYPEKANYPDHSPAQELASPLGKILRLYPTPEGVQPFTIPADNPFVSTPGAYPLIWSRGMRNPFRFSIDKATSNIIIGDVGESKWEELDFGAGGGPAGPVGGKGANYGWPCYEGPDPTVPKPLPACQNEEPPFTAPMLAYEHQAGPPTLCSVIAGYVMHDPTVEALDGRFVYGDFCSGQISSTVPGTTATGTRVETEINASLLAQEEARSGEVGEGTVSFKLQAFGEDGCGRDYILMGAVYRIAGETTANCTGLGLAVSGAGNGRRQRRLLPRHLRPLVPERSGDDLPADPHRRRRLALRRLGRRLRRQRRLRAADGCRPPGDRGVRPGPARAASTRRRR